MSENATERPVSAFQCCYTNFTEQFGKVTRSGWMPVAVSKNIPPNAKNACVKFQEADGYEGNKTPLDEIGEIQKNLYEILGDSAYVYVMRTRYGLSDRANRGNNRFSHAFIFRWENVIARPDIFLRLNRDDFMTDADSANENEEKASRLLKNDGNLDAQNFPDASWRQDAWDSAGLNNRENFSRLIQCVFAQISQARKDKNIRPLFLLYDGQDETLRRMLYCVYSGLPYSMRRELCASSWTDLRNTPKHIIFVKKSSEELWRNERYINPATGENNILENPELSDVKSTLRRGEYIDYAARKLSLDERDEFFKNLDIICVKEFGDLSTGNEFLLDLAYLSFWDREQKQFFTPNQALMSDWNRVSDDILRRLLADSVRSGVTDSIKLDALTQIAYEAAYQRNINIPNNLKTALMDGNGKLRRNAAKTQKIDWIFPEWSRSAPDGQIYDGQYDTQFDEQPPGQPERSSVENTEPKQSKGLLGQMADAAGDFINKFRSNDQSKKETPTERNADMSTPGDNTRNRRTSAPENGSEQAPENRREQARKKFNQRELENMTDNLLSESTKIPDAAKRILSYRNYDHAQILLALLDNNYIREKSDQELRKSRQIVRRYFECALQDIEKNNNPWEAMLSVCATRNAIINIPNHQLLTFISEQIQEKAYRIFESGATPRTGTALESLDGYTEVIKALKPQKFIEDQYLADARNAYYRQLSWDNFSFDLRGEYRRFLTKDSPMTQRIYADFADLSAQYSPDRAEEFLLKIYDFFYKGGYGYEMILYYPQKDTQMDNLYKYLQKKFHSGSKGLAHDYQIWMRLAADAMEKPIMQKVLRIYRLTHSGQSISMNELNQEFYDFISECGKVKSAPSNKITTMGAMALKIYCIEHDSPENPAPLDLWLLIGRYDADTRISENPFRIFDETPNAAVLYQDVNAVAAQSQILPVKSIRQAAHRYSIEKNFKDFNGQKPSQWVLAYEDAHPELPPGECVAQKTSPKKKSGLVASLFGNRKS